MKEYRICLRCGAGFQTTTRYRGWRCKPCRDEPLRKGHFRTYKHDRYIWAKGETVWIKEKPRPRTEEEQREDERRLADWIARGKPL
jgi:DNA-directed RNA polymerase subunit RPC12/RpoP